MLIKKKPVGLKENIIGEKEIDNRTFSLSSKDDDIIGKYIKIINVIRRQEEAEKEKEEISFFYRGQTQESYNLVPYALRSKQYGKEDRYWHEIQKLRENDFAQKSHLDKLSTMQHYSFPTRMMDVSSSPLTALFFACYSLTKDAENFSNNGAVYVYAQKTKKVKYFNSDTALILACLPKFNEEDKKLIYEICKKCRGKLNSHWLTGKRRNVVERLYFEIRSERPAFSQKIKCKDLLKPLFVRPNDSNQRIQRQNGAFIIAGLTKDADDAIEQMKQLKPYKIIIPYGMKKKILKELELLNLNRATLLPDLENTAYYLIEKYTNKNGLYEN